MALPSPRHPSRPSPPTIGCQTPVRAAGADCRRVPSRPCPTSRADDRASDDGRVFTGFGIASAVLGVLAVAAVVLGALIWTQHRSDVDELHYRTRVMQAAADWTGVLINMNKDTVEAEPAQAARGHRRPAQRGLRRDRRAVPQAGADAAGAHHRTGRLGGGRVDPPRPARPERPPPPDRSPSWRRPRRAPTR